MEERDKFEVYRDYLKHEDSVVNYRLMWLLISEGFIFNAYSHDVGSQFGSILRIAGLLIGVAAFLGTYATVIAISRLGLYRFSDEFPGLTGGGSSIAHWLGKVPALGIPLIIISVWSATIWPAQLYIVILCSVCLFCITILFSDML